MRTHGRATLLGRMAGILSVAHNLKSEDASVRQHLEDERNRFEGLEVTNPDAFDEDDDRLEIMAGGDVTVHYNGPPTVEGPVSRPPVVPKPPPVVESATKPSVVEIVAPAVKKAGLSTLAKAGIAALGLTGIGGPAAAIGYWLANLAVDKISQPAVQPPAAKPGQNNFGIGLLPPDKP